MFTSVLEECTASTYGVALLSWVKRGGDKGMRGIKERK
jgi:hypothetical protein